MNIQTIFLLFLLIQTTLSEDTHYLVLGTDYSTIDGVKLSSTAVYGVTEADARIIITEPAKYVLTGTYTGQVKVKLNNPDTDEATLVLNGVTITNPNYPGILITKAREVDSTTYSRQSPITATKAAALDFTNAGIKIILADDSENVVNASHDGKKDAAFFSKVSMVIKGETKGNGKLTVIGDTEGLDTKKHLLIEGGIIYIAAQDDGINTNNDYGSVVLVNGGKLYVNAGLGSEGDGVDSNGMIIINGGEVVSAAKPGADSGLDTNCGLLINGGKVVSVGSSMDMADEGCGQPSMNLIFSSSCSTTSVLTIKDKSGNELISYSPSTAGFVGGSLNDFSAATISHPDFKLNTVYYLYLDGKQLGYTGNNYSPPGPPGGSSGSSSSGGRPGGGSSGSMKTEFVLTSNMMYFSGIAASS